MFCKKCGTEIPNNVAFCTRCGAPVENQAQPQQQSTQTTYNYQPPQGAYNYQPPQQQYYQQPPMMQQGNGKAPVVSLVLGIVGLILAIIPSIFYIGLVISIVGIVFGVKERRTTGKASGLVLSIIGTCLGGVYLLLVILGLSILGLI